MNPAPCGTLDGYNRHRRRHETTCRACRDANNRYNKSYLDRQAHLAAEARARWWPARDYQMWPRVPVRCLACTARRGADVVLADCSCWDEYFGEVS